MHPKVPRAPFKLEVADIVNAAHGNKGLLGSSSDMIRHWVFKMKRLARERPLTEADWVENIGDPEIRGILILAFACDPEMLALEDAHVASSSPAHPTSLDQTMLDPSMQTGQTPPRSLDQTMLL